MPQISETTHQISERPPSPEAERIAQLEKENEELRERASEYRLLFNAMPDGFAVHEILCNEAGTPVDYRFVTVNPGFERLTGLTAARVLGRTVREIIPGIDPAWIARYGGVALTGVPCVFEDYSEQLGKHFSVTAYRTSAYHFACVFVDITSVRKADAELRKLSRAVAQSPVNVVITNTVGEIEYANPCFSATTGYSLDEVRGCNPRFLKSGQTPPAVYRELWETITAGKEWRGEFLNRRKDGKLIWEAGSISPIFDEAGRISHFLCVNEDVTGKRKAFEALQASERRFRLLVESMPIAVQGYDRDRRVVFWNTASEQMYGYTSAEALGRPLEELIVPSESRSEVIASVDAYFSRTADLPTGVRRLQTKSGTPITVISSHVRLCRTDGMPEMYCMHLDRRDEERIREQAALLDATEDAICVVALDRTVTYWNRGAEKMYGVPAAEARGCEIENVVRSSVAHFPAQWPALLAEKEWTADRQHVSRDGSPLDVRVRAKVLLDEQQQPRSVLFVITDVTESKKLEKKFLRAQRLESLGSLASGIAHDLNNVLTPILLSAELLKATARERADADMLGVVSTMARRGSDIVRQLLLFGRGADTAREPLNLGGVIDEISALVRETFPRQLSFVTYAPADLWLVEADKTQMHQVLLNLCVNARDAMGERGQLAIRTSNRTYPRGAADSPEGLAPGDYVCMDVSDTGHGIPAEILEKIFDPFFTTKPVGQGTGLGLSTVLGIVRSHGGVIDVTTSVGKGTTFHLVLPALRSSAETVAEVSHLPQVTGNGERILIVDDEHTIRTTLQHALECRGFSVLLASDGAHAIRVFAEHHAEIQLVIIDSMMPILGGLDAIRALRSRAPALPVIAMSGVPNHREALAAVPGAEVHFLAKPFTAEQALNTIRRALPKS